MTLTSKLKAGLRAFISRHRRTFGQLKDRQSQLLEIGAMSTTVSYYEDQGYVPTALGTENDRLFRVKYGTRGYPWDYSWWNVERDGKTFEIHQNLAVHGAARGQTGTYVIDVGVIDPSRIALREPRVNWPGIPNDALTTYIEAKSFNIYPMLLAHFVGIVHELSPTFLMGQRPGSFIEAGHFDPALVTKGRFKVNSQAIVDGFFQRGFCVRIVPQFEVVVSGLARQGQASPLERDAARVYPHQ